VPAGINRIAENRMTPSARRRIILALRLMAI
jgi:hypothetical protein